MGILRGIGIREKMGNFSNKIGKYRGISGNKNGGFCLFGGER